MNNPSDELKQAVFAYCEENHYWQKFIYPLVTKIFLAGAAYQDPIARREERERVLNLLRDENASELRSAKAVAKYIEEKLK